MTELQMKQCTDCGKLLPRNDFHKDRSKKDGLRSECKGCKSLRDKEQWKKRWKDSSFRKEESERKKKWYVENRERIREKLRVASAEYRLNNREKARKSRRISQAKYRRESPDRARISVVNSHAKSKGVAGSITAKEWTELRDRCGGICPCCGQKVELEIDHINPFSKGGPNLIENIQPLCSLCNDRKHTKTIRYI